MSKRYNMKRKICLVGDSNVGKTCLIRRYITNTFDNNYISTFGTKISKKHVMIKRMNMDINLLLSIWDVFGQEDFKKIHTMALENAKGVVLVCDYTNEDTLKNISTWISRVKNVTDEIPFLLLVNKGDLNRDYAFTEADLQSYSNKLNLPFFITSAKSGHNVINPFYQISNLMTDQIFKKSDKYLCNIK